MSFDWNNYLSISEKINKSTKGKSDDGNNEALRRTAISRAYYSMFHLAVIFAEKKFDYKYKSNEVGGNSSHANIRTEFKSKMGNWKYQQVGLLLSRLHKSRIDCDYKLDGIGNLENKLESNLIMANQIKEILLEN